VVEPLELRSSRLRLRRLRREDATAICAYRALPEVARFQSWESFRPADAERLIADQAAVVPDIPGTWLQLAIVTVERAVVIGDCGIHFREDESRAGHGGAGYCSGVCVRPTRQASSICRDRRGE
jgi:RimJ/RimL family protein N-acetyltransferase